MASAGFGWLRLASAPQQRLQLLRDVTSAVQSFGARDRTERAGPGWTWLDLAGPGWTWLDLIVACQG
jgi:hypothetical protein